LNRIVLVAACALIGSPAFAQDLPSSEQAVQILDVVLERVAVEGAALGIERYDVRMRAALTDTLAAALPVAGSGVDLGLWAAEIRLTTIFDVRSDGVLRSPTPDQVIFTSVDECSARRPEAAVVQFRILDGDQRRGHICGLMFDDGHDLIVLETTAVMEMPDRRAVSRVFASASVQDDIDATRVSMARTVGAHGHLAEAYVQAVTDVLPEAGPTDD